MSCSMSAAHFCKRAERVTMGRGSLRRYDTCSCHPGAWGKKKGLRRARRRLAKDIVRGALAEV
jgi:hypothetical protein